MHELPSDPLAGLDKCIAKQRSNVQVVEPASDLSFAEVAALWEGREEVHAQALTATHIGARRSSSRHSLARKARTFFWGSWRNLSNKSTVKTLPAG